MIIGLVGRCRAGKSELAKVCEELGYKKLYFALPLKQLCADILDISVDGLNQAKNEGTDIGLHIGDDICTILSEETGIPFEQVKETCYGKTLNNVREMLQFIGTDLIRKYDMNWHVNKLRAMIDEDTDYVFDDVRFPNEKKMIDDLGGECWFVVRPTLENVSNHESETSVTWHDCWNRIIINNDTLNTLKFKWETFVSKYSKMKWLRDKEFNKILENGFNFKIEKLSPLDMLFLSEDIFTYVPLERKKEDIEKMEMTPEGGIRIVYKDGSFEFVYNALNIEELKLLL